MLKQERKILHLIKKHFGFSDLIFFDSENHQFICNDLKITYENENSPQIIKSLATQGYLEIHSHPTDFYFCLTYEGYNRFKLLMDSFKISFLTKWVPGFISGVVSAVAEEWLISNFL